MLSYLLGIFLLLGNISAYAHPVIYKGGTVISSQNMEMFSDNQVSYSFHQKWATGLNLWRFKNDDDSSTQFGFARINHLLKRWNSNFSQANIYLSSGVGAAKTDETKAAYLLGAEGDWETRHLFTSLKYYSFNAPNLTSVSMTQGRIGYSPHEANFDKLQTWVMLQGMYMGEVEKTVVVTPLVRFFYNNLLWEMGSSLRGEWFLNLMVHI